MLLVMNAIVLLGVFTLEFLQQASFHWSAIHQEQALVSLFSACIYLLITHFLGVNREIRTKSRAEVFVLVVVCNILLLICSSVLAVTFSPNFSLQKLPLITFLVVANTLSQLAMYQIVLMTDNSLTAESIVVIVRDNHEGELLCQQIREDIRFHQVKLAVIGPPYIKWKAQVLQADLLILGSEVGPAFKQELLSFARDKAKCVQIVPGVSELCLVPQRETTIGQLLAFAYEPLFIPREKLIIKRLIDVIGSISILICFAPVVVLLLVFIPLTSKGPPIYCQRRIGLNGKAFLMYKFRSMVQGAESGTGPIFAAFHDSRITPIGRFIRATRLDELPQIFNVLKGEMSLIGPRPERPEFVDQFREQIHGYDWRHVVRPGITGLGQVRGKYSTDALSKLRYDIWYIRNFSLLLDVKILFQTLVVMVLTNQSRGVKSREDASPTVKNKTFV